MMPDFLEVPPSSFGTRSPQPPRRRASGTSYTNWISSFTHSAAPAVSPGTPIPVPLDLDLDIGSPESDSSAGTIKLSHAPPAPHEHDPETASSSTEVTDATEKRGSSEYSFQMSPVTEVSEHPAPSSGALRYKARSLVGGLVSSIRSIPRAVTHSQVYDRRSAATTAESSYLTSGRTTMTETDALMAHKGPFAPQPFPLPFIFAPQFPPPPHHHHGVQSPLSGSQARSSKFLSEEDTEEPHKGRIGGLVKELSSLPWISSRVAVDYYPGESRTRSVPGKTSSSWYTHTAPATPSDISHPGQLVPEPWFPPARLSPALEVPGEDEGSAAEDEQDPQGAEQETEQLKEELREAKQELIQLRQVIEYQKERIGKLEVEAEQLRKEREESMLQRRKSSVRKSVRANSFRASMRRTSIRVSRPTSSFID